MPQIGQMPEVIWDYTQCCVSLVSSSLAPSLRLRPCVDGSWIHAWLILAQYEGWVNISYTTAVKPSDNCFAHSSFPYRFSGGGLPLATSEQNWDTKQNWNFFGSGSESLSCKAPFPHWHLRVPFTIASWGICRKRDSNDVPITHKVQQGEAHLGSELECSAVFSFISKSLLDDERNPARLVTFLTIKPQRQIH